MGKKKHKESKESKVRNEGSGPSNVVNGNSPTDFSTKTDAFPNSAMSSKQKRPRHDSTTSSQDKKARRNATDSDENDSMKILSTQLGALQQQIEQKDAEIERLNGQMQDKDNLLGTYKSIWMALGLKEMTSQELETATSESDRTKLRSRLGLETSHTGSSSLEKEVTNLKQALTCAICVDFYSSPYTLECGHSACYTCLYHWFEVRKECPTCRRKIRNRPVQSLAIRDQVENYIKHLLPPEERDSAFARALGKQMEVEDKTGKATGKDPWDQIFRSWGHGASVGINDIDDGVRRCRECAWEIEGHTCVNCGAIYSDGESYISSEEERSDSDEDSGEDLTTATDRVVLDDAEEDEEDESDDSFVQDDDAPIEYEEDDDGLSDDASESHASRGPRRAIAVDSDDESSESDGSDDSDESKWNNNQRMANPGRPRIPDSDDDSSFHSEEPTIVRRTIPLEHDSDRGSSVIEDPRRSEDDIKGLRHQEDDDSSSGMDDKDEEESIDSEMKSEDYSQASDSDEQTSGDSDHSD